MGHSSICDFYFAAIFAEPIFLFPLFKKIMLILLKNV